MRATLKARNETMTTQKATEIEQRHNVWIDAKTEMFNVGGGYDAVYGWEPIPKEWKAEQD